MTILEMFEREDIYSIIEKTMAEYYREVFQKEITVSVKKKHFFRKLLIYPRLGIVVPCFPSWPVIKRTYVSFDVQGNLPKKLFAWAYITICFLTFGLLADASMELSDYSVIDRFQVIIPSNRKIRIYNYRKQYVDSILKDGFNDIYFKNEIEVRKNPAYDFILPVTETSGRWYREPLLHGRCLVRTSGENYKRYLKCVLDDLRSIYSDNFMEVNVVDYCKKLADSYYPIIFKIEKEKHITCARKLEGVIRKCVGALGNSELMIPVALSHGDLQTGNIYIDEDNDKVYLIDWETAKQRSVWYDAATVMCSTRRKDRFSDMINHITDVQVKKSVLVFDSEKKRDMRIVSSVLLMEELGFFLEEIVDLPGDMGSEIIERYEHEIDRINWVVLD